MVSVVTITNSLRHNRPTEHYCSQCQSSSLEDFLPEGEAELVTLLLEHLGQAGVAAEENSYLQYRLLVRDGSKTVVTRSI